MSKVSKILGKFKKEKVQEENDDKKFLDGYKNDFVTAVFFSYSRPISTEVLKKMESIYTANTKKELKINYTCSNCILRLMKTVGKWYFSMYPDEVPDNQKDKKI